jgi:putative transposase
MPRQPRHFVPGVSLHIVQRGNGRRTCFRQRADYENYLLALGESALRYGLAIHAYVLMTNHIHLLVTSSCHDGPSKLMQQIGRKYVLQFNKKHGRVGALWEGRFRSSSITTDRYLLACYRYIELNPVRAGLVARPEAYAWSSHKANAYGYANEIITPHGRWMDLGQTSRDRLNAYRRLFLDVSGCGDDDQIRAAVRKGRPVEEGSDPSRN